MSKYRPLYLLDTNVCIVYLKGKSANLNRCFKSLKSNNIAVCSIVKAELFYGSMRSNNPQKALQIQKTFVEQFISFPFNDRCALVYGKLRADLANTGTPIGSNDLLIAAIALANNLILVTHNVREFSRVQGLKLEDWESNGEKKMKLKVIIKGQSIKLLEPIAMAEGSEVTIEISESESKPDWTELPNFWV